MTPVEDVHTSTTGAWCCSRARTSRSTCCAKTHREHRADRATVKPAYRYDLGMRMRMGEVVALRDEWHGREGRRHGAIAKGATPTAATASRRSCSRRTQKREARVVRQRPDGLHQAGVQGAEDPKWCKRATARPAAAAAPIEQVGRRTRPRARGRSWSCCASSTTTEATRCELTLDFDPSFRFDREMMHAAEQPATASAAWAGLLGGSRWWTR